MRLNVHWSLYSGSHDCRSYERGLRDVPKDRWLSWYGQDEPRS